MSHPLGRAVGVVFRAMFVVLCAAGASQAVTMPWTPIGNPGNAPDPFIKSVSQGSVNYKYNIGTYDVTNNQYVEMLNAKDPTGANLLGLYNTSMTTDPDGGISFNAGAPSGSKYSVQAGAGNHPVNFVTWFDALRFTNWMNNGQGNGSTESGAYTLLGGTPVPSNASSITRSPTAVIALPTINEWYKAAYYAPSTHTYFQYPTSSNTQPTPSVPTANPNSANSWNAVGHLTDVGVYTGTKSPYGVFDLAGQVFQMTEALTASNSANSVFAMGGVYTYSPGDPGYSGTLFTANLNVPVSYTGFRLVQLPEPSTLVLGLACLACWAAIRKR